MPLRDHFLSPTRRHASWHGLFAMWPAMMMEPFNAVLPDEFAAGPVVRSGTRDERRFMEPEATDPPPTLTATDEFSDGYEYGAEVDDQVYGETATIVKLVCPGNKDRPAARRAFAATAAADLRRTNRLVIVDIVTEPAGNLFDTTMALCGIAEFPLAFDRTRPHAVSVRRRDYGDRAELDIWAYPLVIGQPLPTLPLWLRDYLCVPLDLEVSYEAACRGLRIP